MTSSTAARATGSALLLSLFLACEAAAPHHPDTTGRIEEHALASEKVGDTYSLFVRLPPSYDQSPDRNFPLILQLDANFDILDEFNVTAGHASKLEADGVIPATIVVGIGYPYATEPKKGRWRDYTIPMLNPDTTGGAATGGAPQFYEFLREELIPFLQARYRIMGPSGRALFGHSLGGLFVAYAFLQYDPAKPFATGFVAASPSLWFDSGSIYTYLDALKARESDVPRKLLVTYGSLEGPVMTSYADDFVQKLGDAGFESLDLGQRSYPTGHAGNISPSFEEGLKFLFEHGLGGGR